MLLRVRNEGHVLAIAEKSAQIGGYCSEGVWVPSMEELMKLCSLVFGYCEGRMQHIAINESL